jgi:hypothetical protein
MNLTAVSLPYIAGEVAVLVGLTIVITCLFGSIIQSRALLIGAGSVVTQLVILLWQYGTMLASSDKYAAEGYWYPLVLVVFTFPIVILVSSAMVVWGLRRRRRSL